MAADQRGGSVKIREVRGGRLLVVLGIALLTLSLVGRIAANAYIEILWFNSLGYSSVFWTRLLWVGGARVLAGVLVGVVFFFTLRVIARSLGGMRIKRRVGDLTISEQVPETLVSAGIGVFSVLAAVWFGAALPESVGLHLLYLLNAPEWGVTDPFLGHDVRFYVIMLPLLRLVVGSGLIISFLVLALAAAGYAGTGALQWGQARFVVEERPRKHLGMIISVFFVMLAGLFWVARYQLVVDGSSGVQGTFGYTDAEANMPAYAILTFLSLSVAVGVLFSSFKNRPLPLLVTFGLLIVGGLGVGQAYPSLIQRFRVEPNELDRESRFILENMRFTRMGFDLTNLERREFDYERTSAVDWQAAASQFDGLPVWSSAALLTTYRQLEARYPYYDFTNVTVDRYEGPNGLVPVAVSVRELLQRGIQDPNWQNLHLRDDYIRGMGAVVSAATDRTPEGRPSMFVSGIPPEFSASAAAPRDLEVTRPNVYIGARPQSGYAIINPRSQGDSAGVVTAARLPGIDFPAGIQLTSFLRKLALAWRFSDASLLFSSEVDRTSRFVFRRSVVERVRRISGDLIRYPEDPYPVIHEGRIVWILEGFTETRSFPLSTLHDLEMGSAVRYVRNSVKVTVDGVTGRVDFYMIDETDPLLQAYVGGFPTLFRPLSDMPEGLRDHIRYPRSMLSLQARVLFQYHQETAPLFHGQQDVWALPQELAQGTTPVSYEPEYGLYRLPGAEEEEFLLTSVFVPRNRQNLTAILTASSSPGHYGELVLFDVPVEDQVPGPRQVEALVEQDPDISRELSLWRTGGSQVWTGHLHLVPVGRTLLYMEPVFLAAAEDAIPELRFFIVSDGYRVTMEETLPEAIQALAQMDGASVPQLTSTGDSVDLPTLDTDQWPAEALALLEAADAALRTGDFQGFGEALDELRALLEGLSSGTIN